MKSITVLGRGYKGGAYLLRIHVAEPLNLSFGRFRGGTPIAVPAGEYAYIGSALAERGSVSLARRLLRHATRSGHQPPHPLQARMLERFRAMRLGPGDLQPPPQKKLHWNIDHLLDQPAATLTPVLLIRTKRPLERPIAQRLAADPHTHPLTPGLGANDHPGGTHLLRVEAEEGWWEGLISSIESLL